MTENPSTPTSLSDARRRTGLTLCQLSAQAGVSISTIQALELGTSTSQPRQMTIDKLLVQLSIDRSTFDRLRHLAHADADRRLKIEAAVAQVNLHDVHETGNLCSVLPGARRQAVPTAAEYETREREARAHPLTADEIRQRLSGLPDRRLDELEVRLRHEDKLNDHRKRRKAPRGITQIEAAARVDISVEAYRKIERGEVMPHHDIVKRFADTFGGGEFALLRHLHIHYRYHSELQPRKCKSRLRKTQAMRRSAS